MRILAINHEFPPLGGGGGVATYQICKHLKDKGHDVEIITQIYDGLKREDSVDGMRIFRVGFKRKEMHTSTKFEMLFFILFSMMRASRLLKDKEYDVVFPFFTLPSGLTALFLRKVYGIPYVLSMQGSDVPNYDPYTHQKNLYIFLKPTIISIWKNARFLVANSGYMKRLALSFYSKAKIQTIYNGVDFENYEKLLRKQGKKFRIICVSRLVKRKGIQYLLRAMPEVRERSKKPIELFILGDGPFKKELERIKEKNNMDYVTFLGRIDHGRLPRYYTDSDIFVLPSIFEAFGVVFAEAMAAGLPVISTKVGGIPELVIDGKTGILVIPRNEKELADAILRLMNDDDARKRMGKEGKERIKRGFTWECIAMDFCILLDESRRAKE